MHTLDTVQRARSVLSFPFTNCKMSLRILSYNIAGLLPKLDNVAFVNYITSFDLVRLTQTYVASEFESNLFKDLGVFVAKAEKLSYHGRYSGGVIVLVRKDFVPFGERIYFDVDNIVLLRIKKVLLGTDKDVMFISAYCHHMTPGIGNKLGMVMAWRSWKSVLWICTMKPTIVTCFSVVT